MSPLRRTLVLAVSMLLLGAAVSAARSPAHVDAKKEALAVLTAQAADWTAGKLESFCAVYAEDAVFVSPKGVTRGRAEILSRYKKRYGTDKSSMGALRFDIVDVRTAPAQDSAMVVLKWHLSWKDKPDSSGHSLVTLLKVDDGWRIAQDASM